MPEGATSGPCDIAVKAIIAGQFEFPEDTELVSAVYAISASRRLNKPVMLEIEHCVEIKSERHCDYLSFGIARCNQHPLPYTFELEDGTFSPRSSYGAVLRSSFSMVGVLKFLGLLHSPSSSSPPESEPGSAESSLALTSPQASVSLIHGAESDRIPDKLTQVSPLQTQTSTGFSPKLNETEFPVSHSGPPDGQNGTDEVDEDSAVNRSLSLSDVAKLNKHGKWIFSSY